MTDNELNNGFIQLALNRMKDAEKHLQEVSNNLKKKPNPTGPSLKELKDSRSCIIKDRNELDQRILELEKVCKEKQKVIDILQDTCTSYEARIKRFQTLARQRKNSKRRVIKIPTKSDLEWEADLIYKYGVQVLRDCRYNGNGIDHNAEVSMEVAWASGQVEDKDRETFKDAIEKFAKENWSNTDKLIYKR